jgi:superoxide reductase
MAQLKEVYKCNKCGLVMEVLTAGCGAPVCCGENMEKLEEKTADKTNEKHVPVIEKIDGGYKVYVGTTLHPMEENHRVEWIELMADGVSYRKYLQAGDKPEAIFNVEANEVSAREYCNLHGLWKG